jgi:hypothetical protein
METYKNKILKPDSTRKGKDDNPGSNRTFKSRNW